MTEDEVAIRPALPSDFNVCVAIDAATEAQFVEAGHPEFADGGTIACAEFSAAANNGRLAVAADQGVVVGWVYLATEGDELAIGQMSVDPGFQGRGIGASLLRWAIEQALVAGEQTLVLNTQSDVVWNKPWYERFGFETVEPAEWTVAMQHTTSEQTAAGLDWSTRVHMRRRLTTGPAYGAGEAAR